MSLRYIDTSAIIPLYVEERHSRAADRLVRAPARRLISRLTVAEATFAIDRRRKRDPHMSGALTADAAARILEQFRAHLDEGLYELVPVGDETFGQAETLSVQVKAPLRTLDALHLAIARRHDAELISFDDGLCAAASELAHPYQTYLPSDLAPVV